MSRRRPARAVYLPAVSLMLALAACQPALMPAAQSEAKFPHAERPATSLGTVSIKVDRLSRELMTGKGMQTKAAADLSLVRLVRLSAKGPGMTTVSTTVDWPIPVGQALNLNVPIGKNRLVMFEGLDADGYAIVTLRAHVPSVTTAPQEITLDSNADVAGRAVERLIALVGTRSAAATILDNDDLGTMLRPYVQSITGYDATANTYRYIPPRSVRTEVIVQRMIDFGIYTLTMAIPGSLFLQAGANVSVTVTDPQGYPVNGARVTILDPNSSAGTTGADGRATINGVPPGTWAVRATSGTYTATNTVTALDQENTGNVLLSLRPQRNEATAVGSQTLTDEVRLLITGTDDPQAGAAQLTTLAERVMEQSASEADALAQLNAAFAAAIRTEADVQQLATRETALDGWTLDSSLAEVDRFTTQGFRTQQSLAGMCNGRPHLTLLYLNGSLETYLDFLQSYLVLFKRLRGSQIIPDVKVLGLFNAGGADGSARTDILRQLDGSGLFPWLASSLWGGRAGGFPANGGPNGVPFVEGLMQEPTGPLYTRQVDRLTRTIETEVMSGNAVVLMPHDQGNHLAKRAMEAIKQRAEAGQYGPNSANVKNAVGTLGLGSPIDPTVPNFSLRQDQVAVDKDFVTVLPTQNARNSMVACSTPAAAVLASCAAEAGGRTTVASPLTGDKALEHHDCVRSYFQGAPWTEIVSKLQADKANMVSPFTAAGSGAMQFQLRWQSVGDVDMYIKEPSSNVVYFNRKIGGYGALDVDNIFSYGPENFYVCDPSRLQPGDEFQFGVNFYRNRGVDPIPYSLYIKAGHTSKTYTGSVTGANFGLTIIGLGRVRVGRDTRTGNLTYDILDGGASIPMQVTIPPGYSLPVP
jgi:hypothetical protein